jgi:hypothetical protein
MKAWSSLLTVTALILISCAGLGRSREEQEAAAKRRAEHIAKLKSYVPADVLETVDPEFYTYSGFRDWWRIPLVYPYSIRCIDTFDTGRLCRHNGKTRISEARGEEPQGLESLVAFNFDGQFLVGHTDREAEDPRTGARVFRWVLFEFATGQIDSFPSKEDLEAAARERGYSGGVDMPNVEAHYKKCFD